MAADAAIFFDLFPFSDKSIPKIRMYSGDFVFIQNEQIHSSKKRLITVLKIKGCSIFLSTCSLFDCF
jgi:hypothetical protein